MENDQTSSILIHFIPCPVVLWILGLPNAVWEDLESFLPELQEAKNRSCLRLFLSLGPLPKDFWVDERDCGLWAVRREGLSFQISGVAQIFKFSHFRTRYLSPLGIKAVPPKMARAFAASAASAWAPSLFSKESHCSSQTCVEVRNVWVTGDRKWMAK